MNNVIFFMLSLKSLLVSFILFKSHIDSGVIKADKGDIRSQMFISILFGYSMALEHVTDLLHLDSSQERIAEEFVKIFLQGIL